MVTQTFVPAAQTGMPVPPNVEVIFYIFTYHILSASYRLVCQRNFRAVCESVDIPNTCLAAQEKHRLRAFFS